LGRTDFADGVCKISSWNQIKTMPRQALEALSDTSRDSRFAIVPDSSISIESPEDCEWYFPVAEFPLEK
jgi:hypothetical protein